MKIQDLIKKLQDVPVNVSVVLECDSDDCHEIESVYWEESRLIPSHPPYWTEPQIVLSPFVPRELGHQKVL